MELLGHTVVLFLVFRENSILFPLWLHQFTFPPTVWEGSFFFHILATFIFVFFFDYNHTDQCKVISHCGFNLYFPDDKRCWASFHVPLDHLHVLFGKMSIQIFSPFLNQVACFFWYWVIWAVYIFWMFTPNIICKSYYWQIFSPIRWVVFSFCNGFLYCA